MDTLTWFHSNGQLLSILYAIMKYWERFSLQSMHVSNQTRTMCTPMWYFACIGNNVYNVSLYNALTGKHDF